MVGSKPLIVATTVARNMNCNFSCTLLNCRERGILKRCQSIWIDAAHEVDDMQRHWNSSGVWVGEIKGPNVEAQRRAACGASVAGATG
jgi:hypothetical protein